MNPTTLDIALYVNKPATKTPLTVKDNVSEHVRIALHACYKEHALLSLVSYLIDLVNRTEKDTQKIQGIENHLHEVRTQVSP